MAILGGLVICFTAGCLMLVFYSVTTITSASAVRSLTNGEAELYHKEQLQRREINRNPEFTNVFFGPFTFRPYLLFFSDIQYDPSDGHNTTMAEYYGMETIRLTYNLPLYHVGNTIDFGGMHEEFDNPRRYFVFGLEDWSGHDYTWSNFNSALFRVSIETPVDSDLRLDMTVNIYEHYGNYVGQTLILLSDGNYIDEVFLSSGGSGVFHDITFIIPKEFVTGRNFLDLMFEFPDAYHPSDVWDDSTDEELRAIGFKSLALDTR